MGWARYVAGAPATAPDIPTATDASIATHAAPTPARTAVRVPRCAAVGRIIAVRVTRLTQPHA